MRLFRISPEASVRRTRAFFGVYIVTRQLSLRRDGSLSLTHVSVDRSHTSHASVDSADGQYEAVESCEMCGCSSRDRGRLSYVNRLTNFRPPSRRRCLQEELACANLNHRLSSTQSKPRALSMTGRSVCLSPTVGIQTTISAHLVLRQMLQKIDLNGGV
jgi:hypothetical protein